MSRKYLMAGNWKMNKTIAEAVVLAQDISNRYDKEWLEYVDIVLIPPYVDIKPVKTVLDFDRRKINVGAQNVFYEPSGAFTGEISVDMLAEIGCEYCIVGHSERRTIFGETNEEVNLKAKALLAARIDPIICVGESLAIRQQGTTLAFVEAQIIAAFAGIEPQNALHCVVGYEPIWAIGTGHTATPQQAEEVCLHIRRVLAELYDASIAQRIRIVYGGSMNEGNVAALLEQPDIDGGLVGGAALNAKSFTYLVDACMKQCAL